jgi:putative endonuclease
MKSKPWFVYILLCDDDTLYTGITTDLEKRLVAHQKGTGARYTRSRGVSKIVYSEKLKNRSEASIRGAELKKLSRKEKILLFRK